MSRPLLARPVVIAAGGTGGHFFPAEALAAELMSRGRRIVLMTDRRSAALTSEVFEGCERLVLSGAGIAGRGLLRAARAVLALLRGIVEARRALGRLRPAVLVGFGGYPSVAPVLAARTLSGRPALVLHEQNAVLGRANRLLARCADLLALSHAATTRVPRRARVAVIGNPVRPAIAALAGAGYEPPSGQIRLLVLGGSLGARVLSDVVPEALARLAVPLRARLTVVQQCRAEDLDRVRAAYQAAGIAAELASFFADVAARLADAHLVISRAGASTVAELAVAGRPAVLVPLPGAIDDHQSANARALGAGAFVLAEREFTAERLAALLERVLADRAALAEAAAAARALGHAGAASALADLVESRIPEESGA